KDKPYQFQTEDFFEPRTALKKSFASLIRASDYRSVAIIPSVSYGMASVANNIDLKKGEEVVVCEGQFPSHVYPWLELVGRSEGKLVQVDAPDLVEHRALMWNERILESINTKTKVVAIPQVHWADGTLFDLKAIRERSRDVGAKLVIDGTQSVGAYPFSIEEIEPDALVCAGYKWLMGPYGVGVAYFAPSFWEGKPIEYNWMNRYKSEDFANLTHYQSQYQPGAERFSAGGSSNFIHTPMLTQAIEQVKKWGTGNIQEYCSRLIEEGIDQLRSKGCFVEEKNGRSNHLFGVYLPEGIDKEQIKRRLREQDIFVSFRGDAIRISPHVYNNREDIERFVSCI
ncbi:MAG: aminotransferase class V-fold PLP-dependent enzyme, partial [Saprospiraceae bacterium]|nr:aminotransferase class V-fold PLP-dependent enzyme [Saprospiraceae bacterium]